MGKRIKKMTKSIKNKVYTEYKNAKKEYENEKKEAEKRAEQKKKEELKKYMEKVSRVTPYLSYYLNSKLFIDNTVIGFQYVCEEHQGYTNRYIKLICSDEQCFALYNDELRNFSDLSFYTPFPLNDVRLALSRVIPYLGWKNSQDYKRGYDITFLNDYPLFEEYLPADSFFKWKKRAIPSIHSFYTVDDINMLDNVTIKYMRKSYAFWLNDSLVQFLKPDLKTYNFWKTHLAPLYNRILEIDKIVDKKKEEQKATLPMKFEENINKTEYDIQAARLEAGLRGEDKVNYVLKWLDDSFVNIIPKDCNKIFLKNEELIDEKQEFDHIVVGDAGVFLIETKYWSGNVVIDKYGNWSRIKEGDEPVGVENPMQQVRRHEKIVKSILDERIPLINIVCLANSKTIIKGLENTSLIVCKSDMLLEIITGYDSGTVLSDEDIKECVRKIEQYMVS